MLKVCYVVVSSGWDRHAQMAYLSARSVRLQDENVQVVIVLETTTPEVGDDLERRLRDVAHVIVRKSSDTPALVSKSRLHRILMREYVTGDLLYVDSDTLAVGPLSDVASIDGDVGAVMDFNRPPGSPWCPPDLEQPFRERGWTFPLPNYFNAGVVFMRDTPAVHALCREWLSRWKEPIGSEAQRDQAAFNSALFASGVPHSPLPNGYNAMIVKRGYRFKTARLLHFFGSDEELAGTLMEHLLKTLQSTGSFDEAAYRKAIREQHPWGPNPEAWRLMHSRNYFRAALAKLTAKSTRTSGHR